MREAKDGQRHVLVKRLAKANQHSWTVQQYCLAKTFTLPRKEWQAHVVIGKYSKAG